MHRPQLVATSKLLLDCENYRLPAADLALSQLALVELLILEYDVQEVAESISRVGYLATETLAAIPGQRNKLIVVEGNRRLAACMCLLAPERVPLERRPTFKKLHELTTDLESLRHLPVVVLSGRAEADAYLIARHTRVSTRKWNPLMQARFFAEKVDEYGGIEAAAIAVKEPVPVIREKLRMYGVVRALRQMALPSDLDDLLGREMHFLTTLMRLFDNEDSRKHMQASFDEACNIAFHGDKDDLRANVTRLLHALKDGAATSRTLNTAEQRSDFLKLVGFQQPAQDASPDDEQAHDGAPPAKPSTTKKGGRPPGGGGHLFDRSAYVFQLQNPNVRSAYEELTKISVRSLPRATALLLRTVLELALVEVMDSSGEVNALKAVRVEEHNKKNERRLREGKPVLGFVDEQPTLAVMLGWLTSDKSSILNPTAKKAVARQISEVRVQDVLNLATHNNLYAVDERKVQDCWRDIGPSLFERIIVKRQTDAT